MAIVGDPELIHFNLHTAGATSSSTVEVDEITADGTLIGKLTTLFDDGSAANGDAVAGDGIYSGVNTVAFTSTGVRYFMGKFSDWSLAGSQRTAAVVITGVNPATESQLQLSIDDNARLSAIAMDALNQGRPAASVLKSLQDALSQDMYVIPGSVQVANGVIQWEDINGILQGFDSNLAHRRRQPGRAGAGSLHRGCSVHDYGRSRLERGNEDILGDVLVLSPFASSLSAFDPSADIVTMFQTAHYSVTYHANAGVTLADFTDLSDYAAIELWGTRPPAARQYRRGLLSQLGSHPGVHGRKPKRPDRTTAFASSMATMLSRQATSLPMGGSLDGTIVLANACESAHDATMANAFTGLGSGSLHRLYAHRQGILRGRQGQRHVDDAAEF